MTGFDFTVTDPDSGVTYTPWTNGAAVGYRMTSPDGRTEYFYLNPSGGSDDSVPTVFVYQGTEGDPAQDAALHHYDVGTACTCPPTRHAIDPDCPIDSEA